MPKYWGKQIFTHGRFPEVGEKQKQKTMASFASSATTCGARKHAWTNILKLLSNQQKLSDHLFVKETLICPMEFKLDKIKIKSCMKTVYSWELDSVDDVKVDLLWNMSSTFFKIMQQYLNLCNLASPIQGCLFWPWAWLLHLGTSNIYIFFWNMNSEIYTVNNINKEILQGLGVAQVAVTKRWPWIEEKTPENHIFFHKKYFFAYIFSLCQNIWGNSRGWKFVSPNILA